MRVGARCDANIYIYMYILKNMSELANGEVLPQIRRCNRIHVAGRQGVPDFLAAAG